jgi:hypothetical protein
MLEPHQQNWFIGILIVVIILASASFLLFLDQYSGAQL